MDYDSISTTMTSTPDLSQLDPDEQLRRNALGMRASVIPQQATSANGPVIAPPSVAQGVNLPPVGQPNKLGQDEAQLEQLKSSPRFMGSQSGIASLKPQSTIGKIGKGILGGLDVIGSTLAPGLTARIPGTSMHHALLENQAAGNVAEDVAQQGKEASAAKDVAEAHKAQSEADAPNAPGTPEQQVLHDLMTGDNGNPRINPETQKPYTYLEAYRAAQKPPAPKNPEIKDTTQGLFSIGPDGKPQPVMYNGQQLQPPQHQGNDFDQFYADFLKDNGLVDTAHNRVRAREQWAAASQPPQRPPQITMVVPGPNGPQIQVAKPGQTLPQGAVTPQQFGSANTPTPQEKTAADRATIVVKNIPRILKEIDDNKDALGPVMGRWNEFMQGKLGDKYPQFAGFRTDLTMAATAVALAHAVGRLPENLREEFDRTLNAPQQNPENLKAVFSAVLPWMQDMAKMGNLKGQSNESPQRPPNVPPNYVYKENGPKGTGWYKP